MRPGRSPQREQFKYRRSTGQPTTPRSQKNAMRCPHDSNGIPSLNACRPVLQKRRQDTPREEGSRGIQKTLNAMAALVSFEKLRSLALDLDGAMDIPLLIGELTPMTLAPSDIEAEIRKYRPRGTTVSSESIG